MYYAQEQSTKNAEQYKVLKLDEPLVVKGDLDITKNLEICDSGSLVVLGNLKVGYYEMLDDIDDKIRTFFCS